MPIQRAKWSTAMRTGLKAVMMRAAMGMPRKEAMVRRTSSHHLALIFQPILVAAIQNQ